MTKLKRSNNIVEAQQLVSFIRAAIDGLPQPDISQAHRLVKANRLAPLAYSLGYNEFKHEFIQNALFAEFREAALVEVTQHFAKLNRRICLLKGISYAATLYDDPACRSMGDIDLLVPWSEFPLADLQLKKLGYRCRQFGKLNRTEHARTYDRGPVTIDLHRSIIQPLRSKIDLDGLWKRARPAIERSDGACRLAAGDELIMHLVHIARSELIVACIAYVDLARLLVAARLPRRQIMTMARGSHVGRGVGIALQAYESLRQEDTSNTCNYAVYPSASELALNDPLNRLRQIAIKSLLVEGPRELVGLWTVGAYEKLHHGFWSINHKRSQKNIPD